jgi:hypothetical protein
LQENDIDPHELKGGDSTLDLYKDKNGNIYVGDKSGKGVGQYTGYNIKNYN